MKDNAKDSAKFYNALALDCDVAADRTRAVIGQIQGLCVSTDIPTCHFSLDMQELSESLGRLTVLADRYRRLAAQR